jgi:hypothetical protein
VRITIKPLELRKMPQMRRLEKHLKSFQSSIIQIRIKEKKKKLRISLQRL